MSDTIVEVVQAPTRPPRKRLVRKTIKSTTTPKKKRTKAKKRTKLPTLKKLKAELWELCKQIIRKRYGNTCYTCEAPNLSGGNWHTGHFIARSICGLTLKYDLRNLRPQCYRCNISLSGSGAVFYRHLVRDVGQEEVDQLFSEKNQLTKETRAFYIDLIQSYKDILIESSSN